MLTLSKTEIDDQETKLNNIFIRRSEYGVALVDNYFRNDVLKYYFETQFNQYIVKHNIGRDMFDMLFENESPDDDANAMQIIFRYFLDFIQFDITSMKSLDAYNLLRSIYITVFLSVLILHRNVINDIHKKAIEILIDIASKDVILFAVDQDFELLQSLIDSAESKLLDSLLQTRFVVKKAILRCMVFKQKTDTSEFIHYLQFPVQLLNNQFDYKNHRFPKDVWSMYDLPKEVKINQEIVENYCKEFVDKNPWFQKMLTYSYTDEEINSMRMYTFRFDTFVNRQYRKMSLDLEKIKELQNHFKLVCEGKIKGDLSIFSRRCNRKNKTIDKFIKSFDYKKECPDHLLGDRFYDRDIHEQEKLYKKGAKIISKVLKGMSRNLSRIIKRPDVILLYRGILIEKKYGITEKNFPTRLEGFTSCSYLMQSAVKFAESFLRVDTGKDQGVVLEMRVEADVNIFTTDVMSEIVFLEHEIVITDRILITYLFDQARVMYEYINGTYFYEAIIVIPCEIHKI